MDTVPDVDNANDLSERAVVLDFWAPSCTRCKMMDPIIDDLAIELADQIEVRRVNVDDSPEIAKQYYVMSVPTVLLLRSGQIAKRIVGYRPDVRAQLVEGLQVDLDAN